MEKEWYMTADSKKVEGPLTAYEMGMKAVQKKLHSEVLVWKQGLPSWTKFDDCTMLFTNQYFLDGMKNNQMMGNKEKGNEDIKEEKKKKKKKKKTKKEDKKKSKKKKKKDKNKEKSSKTVSEEGKNSKSIKQESPTKKSEIEVENKIEEEKVEEANNVPKGMSPTPERKESEEKKDDQSPISRKDLKKITKQEPKGRYGLRIVGKNLEELVDIKLNKKIKKEANQILGNKDLALDDKTRIEKEKKRKKNKKQRERKKKKWYKARMNSSVYIQGLPKDVKKEEIKEMFSRCGVIRLDPVTSEERIKIYKNEQGEIKGDGLVTFMNVESVDLALSIMDGRQIRPGFPVKVEVAVFTQKGEYRERKVVKIDELTKIKYKGKIRYLI
jgi:hypothetical protein